MEEGEEVRPSNVDVYLFAQLLLDKLKIARMGVGKVPMSAGRIAGDYYTKFHVKVEGSEIRAAVNHLRRNGEPIGSNADGYWYCTDESEWEETRARLLERIKNQRAAADAPTIRFGQLKNVELFTGEK